MQCPKCRQPDYRPDVPCPYCGFEADPARMEELTHIQWLLRELESWQQLSVPKPLLTRLQNSYAARQHALETELGLRRPPFTATEAAAAWPRLFRDNVLLEYLTNKRSYLNPVAAQPLQAALRARRDALLDGLADYPTPAAPPTDADRLEAINATLGLLDDLRAANAFATPDAEFHLRPPLLKEQERLEIALGRRKPEKAKEAADRRIGGSADQRISESAMAAPAPKLPPAPMMERLWRMLLSERTLNALLFLGIFLIFAAAISFVVWGWESFSAPLRVAIPTGFTALFFALGWAVRTKTRLYHSGIAMSAIGSLLIPVDFYTLYKSFHISPEVAPEFWLITSLVCLGAYLAVTWIIQNRLFSYLVGFASVGVIWFIGELAHKFIGMPYEWTWAGPSLLTGAWVAVAGALAQRKGRLQVLVEPLRYLALLAGGVLMVLLLGLRLLRGPAFDALHDSLTVAWLVGGLVLGWGAWFYRSRGLWMAAVTALPAAVYLAQAALFHTHEINGAWHALGWALLTPLYILVGHRLAHDARAQDPVGRFQARTTNVWAVLLILAAALWSLTDLSSGAAAACSHTVLVAAITLAALLWQRPAYLHGASALSLTAVTFAMSELAFPIAQLSVGWASLAIVHILLAYLLGQNEGETRRQGEGETIPPSPPLPLSPSSSPPAPPHPLPPSPSFSPSLSLAGYVIAALALLPTLWPFDADLCAYVLGNWVGLTAWGAWLAHQGRVGFVARWPEKGLGHRLSFIAPDSLFHWLTAAAMPFWVWALSAQRRPAGLALTLAWAALAWGSVALSYRLERVRPVYRRPWHVVGLLVSVVAPIVASYVAPDGFAPALCVLSAGILYFADAITRRQSHELAVAAWATAGGLWLFLDRFNLTVDALTFATAALIAGYFLIGLWVERRRSPIFTHRFLTPLYFMSHILTLAALALVYWRPLMATALPYAHWTEAMQQWGGATQLLLGVIYGLYAWGTYREVWGHAAAWLGVAGAGFLVLAYSQGRGSSAAKAALIAIAFVLAERALHALTSTRRFSRRLRAVIRLAWPLYRRPLLVAGWTVSVGTIGLALIRNLWLLGGGRTRQLWAVAGLLLITGLYALSARLFRRARFVTFAALLVFAPWTILTDLGWFTPYRLTPPGFAASWIALAWALFLLNRLVRRFAPDAYALPLRVVAHGLLPFALLWGIADKETSRVTMGMAVAYYALAAWLEYWDARRAATAPTLRLTRFAYPALGLIPVWCVYLLAWHLPNATHELFGLLLIPFGSLGLAAGHWLRKVYCFDNGSAAQRISESADQRISAAADRRDGKTHYSLPISHYQFPVSNLQNPVYGLPAYLTGYLSVIVGTLLTAHIAGLLAGMLLYDALLLLLSAYVFRDAVWDYPAAGLAALSLLIALNEAGVPGNRHGWALIGLAALYFALAWLLRRVKLDAYGAAPLAVGFVVLALGLPPSSEDQIGALWGYGSAALLYGVTAFWLKQPLLLAAACGLSVVPYAVSLQRSLILPEYYGLALLPGAGIALALGRGLDAWRGAWRDFPWTQPARWPAAFVDRVLGWWALPLYTLGFGLGLAAPFVTAGRIDLAALNCLLLIPLFAWAIFYFRRRGWLLALAVAAHSAALLYLKHLGWWEHPAWLWAQLLPLTLLTTGAALWIERRRNEGSPLLFDRWNEWKQILPPFAALRLGVKLLFIGWSRPLYLVAFFDILLGQMAALRGGGTDVGALLSLTHALVLGGLATVWRASLLPYVGALLGAIALERWWGALALAGLRRPVWLAVLAFGYGAVGFGLTLWRDLRQQALPARAAIWRRPLQNSALALSLIVLLMAVWPGLQVTAWTLMALFGFSFRDLVELDVVQAVVGVLSWLGLLYVAATVAYRRARLGYAAVGMLLAGWLLYAFFIREWTELVRVQWYAIPAGVYLLGVAYMEWRRGNRGLARWLDYAALCLLIASLFWQTLRFGWRYALMLGAEGFLLMGFGSARRARRFFYAGMLGVMLATLGQLINALQDVNQWIVFGLIGLLLVGAGALVERKREQITAALREVLEDWE